MSSEEQYSNTGYGIHALVVVGLAGASVALLLALRAGKESRQNIEEMADECKGKCAEEVKAQMLYDLYCKGQETWLAFRKPEQG